MNDVNGSVALATAHKLRSAAAALLADSGVQTDPRLADSLMYEAGEITKRADSIEQQARPSEPEEFGSVVRAISGLSVNGTLWQMAPGHGAHYWEDEHGCVEVWSELTDVEVLRVGVGEPAGKLSQSLRPDPDAYIRGVREANSQACDRLRLLLSEAITSERKNALEKAIQAVEDLA